MFMWTFLWQDKKKKKKLNILFLEKKKGGKATIKVSEDNFHFYLSVFDV